MTTRLIDTPTLRGQDEWAALSPAGAAPTSPARAIAAPEGAGTSEPAAWMFRVREKILSEDERWHVVIGPKPPDVFESVPLYAAPSPTESARPPSSESGAAPTNEFERGWLHCWESTAALRGESGAVQPPAPEEDADAVLVRTLTVEAHPWPGYVFINGHARAIAGAALTPPSTEPPATEPRHDQLSNEEYDRKVSKDLDVIFGTPNSGVPPAPEPRHDHAGYYVGCYYYTDSCFRKDCKKAKP